MSDQLPSPQKAAYVPALCDLHRHEVVQRLGLGPDGWWQGALMAAQLACFRATTFDARFMQRTGGDVANMSLVLGEIGCLGCWQPRAISVSIAIMKRDGGYIHLFELAHGSKRKADSLWPDEWVLPATNEAAP